MLTLAGRIEPGMFAPDQLLHQRYQLQQILGQTPSRQTWLALDQEDAQAAVVVKLLIFGGSMEWQDLKLFEREVQVIKGLDHPQIPKYRDHFSSMAPPSWFASVYTYIPGQSLKYLLDQGKHFSESEIRQVATEILEILIYLHGLSPPILHRDIKPSNVIWGEDDQIYLVDFGAIQSQAPSVGKTFTVVGTYGYAPVEQYGGRAVPASDLYALGATLIHLASGCAPSDLPQKEMRLQFQDQMDLRASISLETSLIQWLERMVEPSVERRIRTAKEALERLRARQIIPLRSPSYPVQPEGSPIRLERTTEYLKIVIPSRLQNLIQIKNKLKILNHRNAGIILGIGLVFALILSSFPVLIPLILILTYLGLKVLQEVEILMTRASFEIQYRLFDWILLRRRILILELEDIFRERVVSRRTRENSQQAFQLVIRTIHGNEFTISTHHNSREEVLWLTREIHTWLDEC